MLSAFEFEGPHYHLSVYLLEVTDWRWILDLTVHWGLPVLLSLGTLQQIIHWWLFHILTVSIRLRPFS